MQVRDIVVSAAFSLLSLMGFSSSQAQANEPHVDVVQYRHATVDGINIFYREAGDPHKPTLVLLHGFPSSSFMFRDLIPLLSGQFHILAPDYPGMGYSDAPPATHFTATFDNVANVMGDLLTQLHATRYVLYMQDVGGPVGMRLALKHPEQVAGLVIQNTSISIDGWAPARLQAAQAGTGAETPERRAAAASRVTLATAILMHKSGAAHPERLNPDSWAGDAFALADPEKRRIMTDLLLDLPRSLALYPAWQDYIRTVKPKTLVIWGRNDPSFETAAGADRIKKLNPLARVYLYNTGHFALDEESVDIAQRIQQVFIRKHAAR